MKQKKRIARRTSRPRARELPLVPPELADTTPLPDRRLIEQQMMDVTRLLEGREFGSIDEINAFLEQALAGGLPPRAEPRTPLEQAQELVYQAMEVTGKRRRQLIDHALALSPDCADAYVLLAEDTGNPREARPLYEQGVRAGERALGPEIFEQEKGHFWSMVQTRPYMRAREGLAEVLWVLGEREQAIAHAWALLELNPGDNQGVRYILQDWLLRTDDVDGMERLFRLYPDDASAAWTFTKALYLFRRGAGAKADKALREALEFNPYVALYLLGAKPLPRKLPQYIGFGDESEAVSYAAHAARLWLDTRGALDWLRTIVAAGPQRARPTGPRRKRR